MAKSIFVASSEPYSGRSVVTLGLINALIVNGHKVGYFKPIITTGLNESQDVHIQTVLSQFALAATYQDSYIFTRQQAMEYHEKGMDGDMIKLLVAKYRMLEERHDTLVIEGSDFTGEGTAFEFEMNLLIAKNLSCPAVLVVSGESKTADQIVHEALSFLRGFKDHGVDVLAIVINKVDPKMQTILEKTIKTVLDADVLLVVIPYSALLKNPTIEDINDTLKGQILFGAGQLKNRVDNYVTGAMQLPSFLGYLKENVLIVTPGDRGDIILGALQANVSDSYPSIAGIVLTAGIQPDDQVIRLIEGSHHVVPIIAVTTGTFETINAIGNIKTRIKPDNKQKIAYAIQLFEEHVPVSELEERLQAYHSNRITPPMFQYQIGRWAAQHQKHIVLPEGNDDRILKAAAQLIRQNIVTLTLLGDPLVISASVKRLGLDLDMNGVTVIDPNHAGNSEDYAQTLFDLRKSKGLSLPEARELIRDISYYGTMMVYKGDADGMVSGAEHTTQHTIKPALQFIKTQPGVSTVSSVFFMCLADRVCVFGDCAVNPDPTAQQLAEIAISSARTAERFGIEPRIAMLSYSSGNSGIGEDVDKVRMATKIVKETRPDLLIEGPIQYDAAVDPSVAKQKMPGSPVAGKANVLIFPDLNTGNNTYKAVQRETGALAIGPMLQGLNKPVNDLSRGCTVDDIFNTVVITAIQAQDIHEPQTVNQ
ncbi:MAG: phosphate acetyltransferase [Mucilaginibacter sp.]|uniref:phosphate acetyltransferase n=1 Tax=Mucilaginibacter sp. TaxID=1882438 RepID=UPI003263647E